MSKLVAENERVNVVGLRVDVCNQNSAIRQIAELVKKGTGGYICVSNVHMTMEARDNAEYGTIINRADLVIPDGMPMVWMQKLQGARLAKRVRGNDLMIGLCEYAEENDLTVGFYGGRQTAIDAILERAKIDYPNLKIVYAFSPPFRPLAPEEDAEITAEINSRKPDILFVGLGCPKQEIWMAAHRDKIQSVMIGVGAAFDFFAGNVKESPEWLSKIGLEWLFRFAQEPRRLWKRYLVLNPRFVWLAAMQLLKSRR